jgi:translation initiation factor 2B subunit (eIF-2B alpha/beta/delta family)
MLSRTTSQTDAAIGDIASDNVSGAAEILRRAGEVFSLLSAEVTNQPSLGASLSIEEAQQAVRETCIALAKAQPDMSSLLRLASEALSAARSETAGREALKSAADAARRFVESATHSAHAAATHAVSLIRDGSKLLTHSRSSTVLEALIEARRAGKHFEVIATESRPMFEGRKLADELSSRGINVTVIADAAASLFIERADLIMVGADEVTPEHVVNKIGTRMIALAAHERGLPIYALCDTSKFIAADYLSDVIRDQRNAGELWPDAPEGFAVVNSYFEPTPLAYFTGVITELGVLSDTEASRLAGKAWLDPILLEALGEPAR